MFNTVEIVLAPIFTTACPSQLFEILVFLKTTENIFSSEMQIQNIKFTKYFLKVKKI